MAKFTNSLKDALSSEVDAVESLEPIKPDEERCIGRLIKVSEDGWGFISSKDIKFTRIFFHWTSLKQDTLHFTKLVKGMKVEFTPVEVPEKGFRAIKIRVIEDGSIPPVQT